MLASHQAAPLAEAPLVARLGDRGLFPTLEPAAYLDHAAISPHASDTIGCAALAAARFAPHWPNHRAELPGVLAAIDAALGTS